jgi:hypothetical protein
MIIKYSYSVSIEIRTGEDEIKAEDKTDTVIDVEPLSVFDFEEGGVRDVFSLLP